MIVGHGDIASALREGGVDREDWVFFAAGVSNSSDYVWESEYQREKDLLATIPDEEDSPRLIYFSSLCVFYSNSRYARHKREIEDHLFRYHIHYAVIRMGNITWGTNPHTLINFMRERERLGLPQDIQDVYRYIVDKDEFLHWIRLIPEWSCEMNIPGRRMKVADIYREFVLGERVMA